MSSQPWSVSATPVEASIQCVIEEDISDGLVPVCGRVELPWRVQSKLQNHEQINDCWFLKPLNLGWFETKPWITESESQHLKWHSPIGLTICDPFPYVSEDRRGNSYMIFFSPPIIEFVHWNGPYHTIGSELQSWTVLTRYLFVFSNTPLWKLKKTKTKQKLESTKIKLGIEFKPHDSPSICIMLTPVVSNTFMDTDHC